MTQTLKDLRYPKDPSSLVALQQVKHITRSLFPDGRAEKADRADGSGSVKPLKHPISIPIPIMTSDKAEELLGELGYFIDNLLLQLKEEMTSRLGDQLEIQGQGLDEWNKRFVRNDL